MRLLLLILGATIVASILGAAGLYFYYNSQVNQPNDGNNVQLLVTIEQGTSIRELSQQLEKQGIISDARVFEAYIRLNNEEPNILAGTYETEDNLTMPEVLQDLKVPINREVRVTIPEGLRYDQVADRLDNVLKISPNWDKQRFLELAENPGNTFDNPILASKPEGKSLEGFLFPDTYIFDIETSTTQAMEKLISNTQNRISGELLSDIEQSQFSVYEVLNFASMIERETKFEEDRYLVGDVLYKRYTEGWTLGIDATLLYEQGDWTSPLTRAELDADTPYNTRVNTGLPPTPICNPGLESIKGFVYREENPYYFYVSDLEGNIYYAEDSAGHQENIRNHLNK